MSIDATGPDSPLLPYASPVPLALAGEMLRDGALLVVRDGITLPRQCVVCGEAMEKGGAGAKAVLLRFTWDSSFTMTRQTSLQLRRKASVRAFLCGAHYRKWWMGCLIGGGASAISILTMIAGMGIAVYSDASDVPRATPLGIGLTIGGFAATICSLFFYAFRTRTLTCKRIEGGYMYLEGAAAEFIEPLPAIPQGAPSAASG